MDEAPDPPTLPLKDRAARLDDEGADGRYADRGRLGAGAMGDVRLCDDLRIGREVALKIARGEDGGDGFARERFVHEARVQARLEHPSIVPVYDIGADRSGAPFFTMKRVRGVTLRRVLQGLRSGDAAMQAQFSRRRLLTAFANVCLTVDYAHGRDVFHRDLKPSNIMLGSYGELYVLDWGVARAAGIRGDTSAFGPTPAGDIVGTPGYVAPEQVRGEAIDACADVYALGAVLFEILALEPLHPPSAAAAIASTLAGADARPSVRAPQLDVPPELDEICRQATALSPSERFSSARALYESIDRFLEGDRDLERRRELSMTHTHAALGLVEQALDADAAGSSIDERTDAMAEVSRALAFDPANTEARRLLLRLLTEPPREVPPDVEQELERHHHAQKRLFARGGAAFYLSGLVITPIVYVLMGARPIWFLFLVAGLFGGAAAMLVRVARAESDSRPAQISRVVLTTLAVSSFSAAVGPLILVPSLAMTNAIGFLMQPERGRRPLVLGMSCAAILLPLSLEWLGLVPPSYIVEHGRVIVNNRLLSFTAGTHAFLIVLTLAFVVAIGIYFIRFRDMLTDAERRLYLHAWQLRQLVPNEAVGAPARIPLAEPVVDRSRVPNRGTLPTGK